MKYHMRSILSIILLIELLILSDSSLLAQTQWTKVGAGPVLDAGIPGEWDSHYITDPYVIFDNGLYKMWYSSPKSSGGRMHIGYAISSDGVNWRKSKDNPVLYSGMPGDWDIHGVIDPSVLYDNGIYKMWYVGLLNSHMRPMYAESNDGMDWTKIDSVNPLLDIGPPGSWEAEDIGYKAVTKIDTTFYMWYMGRDFEDIKYGIGLANLLFYNFQSFFSTLFP